MENLLLHFRKEIYIIDRKVDSDNPVAKYTALHKDYISILMVHTLVIGRIGSWVSWYSW